MSALKEAPEVETLEFKWVKKRGIGGKKKEVQFYESFIYDGDEYSLFDCVYLYKDDEPEPYIGKLIKIWEQPEKLKKVKVLWFFRPIEIVNYIGDDEAAENELFLATGEGLGLANVNPLEAIAGKCNVVCTSKDDKNPQPSEEELKMADYIFHRTFNVNTFVISDKIDEKIAGIQDKFIYNRTDGKESSNFSRKTEENGKVVGSTSDLELPIKLNSPRVAENSVGHEKRDNSVGCSKPDNLVRKEDEQLKAPGIKRDPLPGETLVSNEAAGTIGKQENVLHQKELQTLRSDSGKVDGKTGKVAISQVHENEKLKPVNGLSAFDRPSMKARDENLVKSYKETQPTISTPSSLNKDKNEASVHPSKKSKVVNSVKSSKKPKPSISSPSSLNKAKNEASSELPKNARVDKSSNEPQPTIFTLSSPKKDKNAQKNPTQEDSEEDDVAEFSGRMSSASEDIKMSKVVEDSLAQEKGNLKKVKSDEKKGKLSNGRVSKPAVTRTEKGISTDDQIVEVGRRPLTDRSKWFKGLPWEERMETAHDQGTLVLLENLDPSYTSSEVEDIIWHGFRENCTAKVVPKIAISSPHSGQAFVIFKTRDAADMVIRKLDEGCLMLPNGRPLIASPGSPPKSGKSSMLVGHLFIDKIKLQTQREDIKRAVSTSHCSQPNTVEYEMAMEWCLLQARADKYWKELYKQQWDEMRKLKADLKSK